MHAQVHPDAAFFLTGRRPEGKDAGLGLRPALFARYRDLAALRYDYPLVLLADAADPRVFEPLSALVDRAIEAGAERAQSLRGERLLRAEAAAGQGGTSAALTGVEGELVDCDAALPARLAAHVWRAVQAAKAAAFRRHVERLTVLLADMLRADDARSERARGAANLRATFGGLHERAFDFDAMSRLLGTVSTQGSLSAGRRKRIESTLAELRAQRFYAEGATEALAFRFERCSAALQAFRERAPALQRLAKAITVAELEIQGEFTAEPYDALFERVAEGGLDLRDLALFPDYLVCVREEGVRGAEQDALLEILAGGLPVKILLQTDDLLAEPLGRAGHAAPGAHVRQLVHAALGLHGVYVVQASAAQLPAQRAPLLGAFRASGAALVSVYSGAGGAAAGLPPYLAAAAATESRVFPSFAYDPSAGTDWAARFSLAGNPQPERDWPRHTLEHEDAEHQRVLTELAFTPLEFAACDARYARHFAVAPRAGGGRLVPAADCIDRETKGVPDELPSLLMADDEHRVHRVIVDDWLLRLARRVAEAWRSLQELGGVRNSHVARALAEERRKPEEGATAPTPASAPAAAPEPSAAAAPPPPAGDDAYIETPRCSSCDECIQINGRMFGYDANKQARIVDASAGTFRQLVEAAESCQVAIIHPGKPRNPAEPGLEELLKRAEAFR